MKQAAFFAKEERERAERQAQALEEAITALREEFLTTEEERYEAYLLEQANLCEEEAFELEKEMQMMENEEMILREQELAWLRQMWHDEAVTAMMEPPVVGQRMYRVIDWHNEACTVLLVNFDARTAKVYYNLTGHTKTQP